MLYEIRVRPNCDPESCHVLRSTCSFPFLLPLSTISTLWLSLSQLSLSGTFFRCGKRKCNKRRRQLALAKMNVIHSFTRSFIHSLSLPPIRRRRRIPVYFAHAIKPGIGLDSPQLHLLSSPPPSLLALPVRTGQVNYNLHCLSPRSSVCFISLSLSSPPN